MSPVHRPPHLAKLVIGLGLVVSACAGPDLSTGAQLDPADLAVPEADGTPALTLANPNEVYDPVRAGEDLPDGFRVVLARDAIFPVYAPTFVPAELVAWGDENLVIGVDLADEPRAYPVGFLSRREMVIDNHRGIPTLVTW